MIYLNKYNKFRNNLETNESMKSWLSSFLIMSSLGLVPLSLKSATPQDKKEFIESQPQDKIDAAKFIDYIDKFGNGRELDSIWKEFIVKDTITSSLEDVENYISKDGKKYHFNKNWIEHDFSHVDIRKFTPDNWLMDMGSLVPDRMEPTINNWISDYEDKTSIEICILTVTSLDDEPIEMYAQDQFDRLEIGKSGADNGILMVFDLENRKSRIQTGDGMEEFLPDLVCSRILSDVVKPNFKNGDYYTGIIDALEVIREKLGDEAFENKVQWLKQKKEKEKMEAEVAFQEFIDYLMIGGFVVAVLALVGYFMYKSYRNQKTKEEISKMFGSLEKLISTYPTSTLIDSKRLRSDLKHLKSEMDNIEIATSNVKSDPKIKGENLLEKISDLRSMADEAISRYISHVGNISSNLNGIKNIDQVTKRAYSAIEKAILSYNKIKEYGYNPNLPPSKSEVDDLLPLTIVAASLVSSNIDEACDNYDFLMGKISHILTRSDDIQRTLQGIEQAKSSIGSAKSTIDTLLSSMMRYSQWSRSGEEDRVRSQSSKFLGSLSSAGPKPDYLTLNKSLVSVSEVIQDMTRKWRGRKEEEDRSREEEERRERQRRDDASRSSSSISSGGFGGYGGGKSSGGGASGSF